MDQWLYASHDDSIVAAAELCHRVNSWRLNVEACNSLEAANPLAYEAVPPSDQTRPRNARRQKPYARPPDSHHRALQTDLELQPASFLDSRQIRAVPEVARDTGGMSGSPSMTASVALDLPHPEYNPLISCQPDVLAAEYYRLAYIFENLGAERRKQELRWLQTSSKDAMAGLMELGSNMRHVVNAAQYVIKYSHKNGWDIDFEALARGKAPPPTTARVLPSRVRELVCSNGISNGQDLNAAWHLYPAA